MYIHVHIGLFTLHISSVVTRPEIPTSSEAVYNDPSQCVLSAHCSLDPGAVVDVHSAVEIH